MKRLLIASLLLASVNAVAGLYIDPQQLKDDLAAKEIRAQAFKNCPRGKFKTVGEREACQNQYFDKAKEKYPTRGTEAYSEKNYARLSKAEAEQKLIELKKIWDTSDIVLASNHTPGAIGSNDAEQEAWWIQKNIFKATRTQSDPWFIECKVQKWKATVDQCPLGKGGNP